MSKHNLSLTIGWLYPELMSTYGDRGNIIVLQKRCEWRGIRTTILPIDQNTTQKKIGTIDLLFGGGSQDREQAIVMRDLYKKKKAIKEVIERNVPALFVCGAPQLMGRYYEPAAGKRIDGLGIFDMVTKYDTHKQRLIGNVMAEASVLESKIVGFENHGGRTYLGKNIQPFAKIIKGFGNNGEDGTEGVVYKNAIGCYLHGPLLPKNPQIADYLITKALEVKYKKEIELKSIDDSLEQQAQDIIISRL